MAHVERRIPTFFLEVDNEKSKLLCLKSKAKGERRDKRNDEDLSRMKKAFCGVVS